MPGNDDSIYTSAAQTAFNVLSAAANPEAPIENRVKGYVNILKCPSYYEEMKVVAAFGLVAIAQDGTHPLEARAEAQSAVISFMPETSAPHQQAKEVKFTQPKKPTEYADYATL